MESIELKTVEEVAEYVATRWRKTLQAYVDKMDETEMAANGIHVPDPIYWERFQSMLRVETKWRLSTKQLADYDLRVDYSPGRVLADAAKMAMIKIFDVGWPWKTGMRVCNSQVGDGYRVISWDMA